MAVEARRGCGYRKVGGLYLVSGGGGVPCDRLPIRLDVCPVCSHGFKQSRGWTWVDLFGLVGGNHEMCADVRGARLGCPLCHDVKGIGRAGLLWIGEKFYKTPADFDREGAKLGFSRRISAVPRGFKVGETWVMLAHPIGLQEGFKCNINKCKWEGPQKQVHQSQNDEPPIPHSEAGCVPKFIPVIFTLWRSSRIEKILKESQRNSAEAEELTKQGITPVFVPDDDPDHQGTVYDKDEEEETAAAA